MNKLLVLLAGLAIAGTASAQVDPTRPMVTGKGNVNARPGQVIVTNQTATNPAKPDEKEAVALDKFEVTGSLIKRAPAAKKAAAAKR
jgi:hypothetical protein